MISSQRTRKFRQLMWQPTQLNNPSEGWPHLYCTKIIYVYHARYTKRCSKAFNKNDTEYYLRWTRPIQFTVNIFATVYADKWKRNHSKNILILLITEWRHHCKTKYEQTTALLQQRISHAMRTHQFRAAFVWMWANECQYNGNAIHAYNFLVP